MGLGERVQRREEVEEDLGCLEGEAQGGERADRREGFVAIRKEVRADKAGGRRTNPDGWISRGSNRLGQRRAFLRWGSEEQSRGSGEGLKEITVKIGGAPNKTIAKKPAGVIKEIQ